MVGSNTIMYLRDNTAILLDMVYLREEGAMCLHAWKLFTDGTGGGKMVVKQVVNVSERYKLWTLGGGVD